MINWNYWKDRVYYQEEFKKRALGKSPEMESLKFLSELVYQNYSPGDKILDAGCGTGHFILSLQKKIGEIFNFTGIDITSPYILDAKEIFRSNSSYKFCEGDIRRLPFSNGSFDITVCSNTIPHIPNVNIALKELLRVTKRLLLVRMLISDETLITKKALDDILDENGEPQNFMYVNIYSKNFIYSSLDLPQSAIKFLEDQFDSENIKQHYENHKKKAGEQIATKIIGNHQVKGHLTLPWKILKINIS